jgi:RNase H-fold protein (predicted Holliday junction resolvase)
MKKYYKEESRNSFFKTVPDGSGKNTLTIEEITFGCMLRIADASEKAAQSFNELIEDRDKYKRWYQSEREKLERARKTISGLKGAMTKLKKKNEK